MHSAGFEPAAFNIKLNSVVFYFLNKKNNFFSCFIFKYLYYVYMKKFKYISTDNGICTNFLCKNISNYKNECVFD